MSVYSVEPQSNIYGLHQKKLVSPIMYLLAKVQTQENPKIIKSYSAEVGKSDKELNQVVKSKYNLFKQNEPQSVDGSGAKKRFTFARKR